MDDVDTVVIVMKFPSNVIATIDLSRNGSYGYDQRIEVYVRMCIFYNSYAVFQTIVGL